MPGEENGPANNNPVNLYLITLYEGKSYNKTQMFPISSQDIHVFELHELFVNIILS